jgi:hypothetical protein
VALPRIREAHLTSITHHPTPINRFS